VSPPEIAFLALGLILGSAVGAALVEALRNRPVSRREVRITVAPNSIRARKSVTLASSDPVATLPSVPGSPGDDAWLERRLAGTPVPDGGDPLPGPAGSNGRTRVSSGRVRLPDAAVPVPVARAVAASAVASRPARRSDTTGGSTPTGRGADAPASRTVPAHEPGAQADRPAARSPADPSPRRTGVLLRQPADLPRPAVPQTAVAVSIQPEASHDLGVQLDTPAAEPMNAQDGRPVASSGAPAGEAGSSASDASMPGATGIPACEAERTHVEERCALADAAREQARRAADGLREAQKAYDALREQVERAQMLADPREIRASKDALHRGFRAARATAATPEAAEAAAREWLTEINKLNTAARDAAHLVQTGGAALRERLPGMERLAVEADAARISAESAEAACQEARAALARCEEQAVRAASAAAASAAAEAALPVPSTLDEIWPTEPEAPLPAPADGLIPGDDSAPVIRVLRGDRVARDRLIATLAGADPDALRQWNLRIAGLTDAIVARAIEDGYLVLPDEGFWGLFNRREQREIVQALSALGFRFDGLGGFADGRTPAHRDLSMAVGYAGLDRLRIRIWPRESELASLYEDARIAADEWLVDAAGDLSLGRMVDALGGRAGELAEVWNAWGRVRPALLGDV
jgi:hypothetical protein